MKTKHIGKRMLAIFFALAFCLTLLPMTIFADGEEQAVTYKQATTLENGGEYLLVASRDNTTYALQNTSNINNGKSITINSDGTVSGDISDCLWSVSGIGGFTFTNGTNKIGTDNTNQLKIEGSPTYSSWRLDNSLLLITGNNSFTYALDFDNNNRFVLTQTNVTVTPKVTFYKKVVDTGVKVTPSSKELNVGETVQLGAEVTGDGTVSWSSDNEDVATVDESGLVTAVGKGTATITATSSEDSTKTGTCTVTVSLEKTFIDITEKGSFFPENADFLIVGNSGTAALSNNGGTVGSKTVSLNEDGTITTKDDSIIWSATKSNGTFTIFNGGKNLGMSTSHGLELDDSGSPWTWTRNDSVHLFTTPDNANNKWAIRWNTNSFDCLNNYTNLGVSYYAECYNITAPGDIEHGSVTAQAKGYVGESVPITITPDTGYVLDDLTATNKSTGETLNIWSGYTIVMPAADVEITATFKEHVPEFTAHDLTLNEHLEVGFVMDLTALTDAQIADESSYLSYTVGHDNVTTGSGTILAKDTFVEVGKRNFHVPVTSLQMADTVTATFHCEGYDDVTNTYSVKEYIDDFLKGQYSGNQVELVKAVADYGHYAQIYLKDVHKFTVGTQPTDKYTEMPACRNYNSNVWDKVKSTLGDQYVPSFTKGDGIEKFQLQLSLEGETGMRIIVVPKDGAGLSDTNASFEEGYVDHVITFEEGIAEIRGIKASELKYDATITGKADGSDFSGTASPLSYAHLVLNNDNSTVANKNLAAALCIYAYAAGDYPIYVIPGE